MLVHLEMTNIVLIAALSNDFFVFSMLTDFNLHVVRLLNKAVAVLNFDPRR